MTNFNDPQWKALASDLRTRGWGFGPPLWSGDRDQAKAWLKRSSGTEAAGVDGGYDIWIDLDVWEPGFNEWGRFGAAYETNPTATPEQIGIKRR